MYHLRHIGLSLVLALGFITMPATAAQRSVPLEEMAPISIPENMSEENIKKAILSSAARLTWQVIAEKPGHVMLKLTRRAHVVTVQINYDQQQARIQYVSSSNMGEQMVGGVRLIHPKYHNWTRNLLTEIQANLLRL